jgi:hypothetical protein
LSAVRHQLCLALYLLASSRVYAQQTETRTPAAPALNGLNAAVTLAGAHDSYVGWYNVATPALSYAFSPRYSGDLSMSIYPYRLAPAGDGHLRFAGGDLGDMLLEAHATFAPGNYRDIATASITLPTGNRGDGLGTGRVTFDVDDRAEYSPARWTGRTTFLVDIGGGDSSGLVNRLVTEDDASLGPLAQFQLGATTWLTDSIALQSIAYEQLPIGDQKTYTTVGAFGAPPRQIVTGRRVNEDNGFTTSLYIPLSAHTTLTSSYNRSLRLHLDTVSVGLTFSWKGTTRRHDSLIDRAMREAESGAAITPPPR